MWAYSLAIAIGKFKCTVVMLIKVDKKKLVDNTILITVNFRLGKVTKKNSIKRRFFLFIYGPACH